MNQSLADYFSRKAHLFNGEHNLKKKLAWKINAFKNSACASQPLFDDEVDAVLEECHFISQEMSSLTLLDQRDLSDELGFIYYCISTIVTDNNKSVEILKKQLDLPNWWYKENEIHRLIDEKTGASKISAPISTSLNIVFLLANLDGDSDTYFFYIVNQDIVFTSDREDPFNPVFLMFGIDHTVVIDTSLRKNFTGEYSEYDKCMVYIQEQVDSFRNIH